MPQNGAHAMQVSCSSRPFAHALRDGSMTQLEWIDLCASDLPLDGIENDVGLGAGLPGRRLVEEQNLGAEPDRDQPLLQPRRRRFHSHPTPR